MEPKILKKVNELQNHLKVKFSLPQTRPTLEELVNILKDIENLPLENRSEEIWKEIVYKHVKFEGFYKYAGLDSSDLNLLHQQIQSLLNEK